MRENRRRAAATFDLADTELLTVHQIHSTDVLAVADQRWTSPGAPKADALVTDRPGVERKSCECYGVVKTETDRLLPQKEIPLTARGA